MARMNQKKALGQQGELIATSFLQRKGYTILWRNFFCRGGEIDIVAYHKKTIRIVEVKTRSSEAYGWGEEAVTHTKRRTLYKAAMVFAQTAGISFSAMRFDVIAIDCDYKKRLATIRHYQNIEL